MEIFKKIDKLYTKAVQTIIGDIPLKNDDNKKDNKDDFQTAGQAALVIKEKILSIGKPQDDTLLYKEVVKREKAEAKEAKKLEKEAKSTAKKEASTAKKATKSKTATTAKPKAKTTTTAKPKAKTATTAKPKAKTATTAKPKAKTATTAKPKAKTATTAKPKAKTATTAKPKAKTATTAKPKAKTAKKPTKRDEKIALYAKDIKIHYGSVDEAFLAIIVKNLGPSIYNENAESVSCDDPKELATVRKNFLMKKLELDASQTVLDAAIADVCIELKKAKIKYRATFYYSLTKKFKKESSLS